MNKIKTHGATMDKRAKDYTGRRFGSLTAVRYVARPDGQSKAGANWLCACDCGNEKIVKARNLKSGSVVSCGCKWGTRHPSSAYEMTFEEIAEAVGDTRRNVQRDFQRALSKTLVVAAALGVESEWREMLGIAEQREPWMVWE